MLKNIQLNFTGNETRIRILKPAGAAAAVLVLVVVSATLLNNVVATPISPREAKIRGWVNDLSEDGLTAKRQLAQTQLEAAGEEAVPALVTALHSNNVNVRRNAADLLGFIGSTRATDALLDTLGTDPASAIRANAAWALGEIKDPTALTALERASVLDPSAPVRENANLALANIHESLILRAGRDPSQVNVVAVAPNAANTLYLASARDLLISHDKGAQWETFAGAMPSVVSALAVNPTNPNIIYAGLHSQGLYLSTDGGKTWQSLTRNFSNEAIGTSTVTSIIVDPANPMRVVIAHGIRIGTTHTDFYPLGILSSNDGGKTWGNVIDLEDGQLVTRLQVNGGKVYALASDKVIVSGLN
jgi:hypothetical protein